MVARLEDYKIPDATLNACSILLPLYNGAQFLEAAISTISSMMREKDELILVNDGSEDILPRELVQLAKSVKQIKVINKKHSGLVKTLNFGIKHCSNDLIARVDIDDMYSPNRIYRQVEFMEKNLNCAAVFSDYRFVGRNGEQFGSLPTAISPLLTRLSLLNPQRTPHPSVMFRKSAVEYVGGYIASDFPAEDLSLWMRLSTHFEIRTIPEILLFYTLHEGSISKRLNGQMMLKTNELVRSFVEKIQIENILAEVFRKLCC